jgi:hypothetical protein
MDKSGVRHGGGRLLVTESSGGPNGSDIGLEGRAGQPPRN